MSIAYRVDHDARVVVAVGQGILDLSRVTKIDMASHQIQNLAWAAASMDEKTSNSRLAIVAPADLSFGLSRMFQTHRELNPPSGRQINFGNFDYETGLNVLAGMQSRKGTFVELKTSLYSGPAPKLRVIIGYNF